MQTEKLIVKITTKHFRKSAGFINNERCPLALAIKDAVCSDSVQVLTRFVYIDEKKFRIEGGFTADGDRWGMGISKMISTAKRNPKKRYPTKYITLLRV
jgi:hypothetical protein